MRGQDAIIAARMAGSKPDSIHLLTEAFPVGVPAWSIPADWVFVEPADTVRRLDLRFVIGCMVLVDGQDAARVHALAEAATKAGAARVIGHVVKARGDTFDLIEITDTAEVMTWHN